MSESDNQSLVDDLQPVGVTLDFALHKVFLEFADGYDEEDRNTLSTLLTDRLLRVMDEVFEDLKELEGVV